MPDFFQKDLQPNKPLFARLLQREGRIVDRSWSAIGRADLFEQPQYKNIKWLYNDGLSSTLLCRPVTTSAQAELLEQHFLYFPFLAHPSKNVLIIGSGGGLEVRLAQLSGVRHTVAVEINPAIIRLVRLWKDFAGPVYDQPGVDLKIEEGRKFLITDRQTYDLVQMSLTGIGTATAESYVLTEGYLFTQEGFRSLFQHLNPDGMLVIINDAPLILLRQCVTAAWVLSESYHIPPQDVMKYFCVIENLPQEASSYRFLVLISRSPIDSEALEKKIRQKRYRTLWLAGKAALPPFDQIDKFGLDAFVAHQPYNFSPCTDDRPFLFNLAKRFKENFFFCWPYLAVALFAWLIFVGILLRDRADIGTLSWRLSIFALLVGMGFMFLELGYLNKFALAAGGPAKILPFLLCVLLLWCGLGSQWALPLARRFPIRLTHYCLLVGLLNGLTLFYIAHHYTLPSILSDTGRYAAITMLLGFPGLALGMPFPTLLGNLERGKPGVLAGLWGINGLGSVIGGSLFMVLSLQCGFTFCLAAGIFLYFAAAWVAYRI